MLPSSRLRFIHTPTTNTAAMSRYDPARDCFTSDPPPTPTTQAPPPPSPPPQTPIPEEPAPPPAPPSSAATTTRYDPVHEPDSTPSSKPAPPQSPLLPTNDALPAATSASPSRKRKASADPPPFRPPNDGQTIPLTQANLPKIKRRRPAAGDGASSTSTPHRRERTRDRYRYHSPPPPLIPKATEEQDPTPPPSRKSSPPRQRKRPGAAARLSEKEKEELRRTFAKREEDEKAKSSSANPANARDDELVRSHYNDKRELGKTWRQTSSKIKGLRSFNNWVKSTLIQKFSPSDDFDPRRPPSTDPNDHLVVLDMGCGKGGDLLKWKSAPQEVGFYLGVDNADVSIAHAHDRYDLMLRDQRRGRGRTNRSVFQAEFHAMDCWTKSLDQIPIAHRIGFDPNVGSRSAARFGGGGFDVVTMMFCMHYAFETEAKCRTMLRNVAGSLKKGGRFIGTIPSSDIISARVRGDNKKDHPPDEEEKGVQEWGNNIYRVKFAAPHRVRGCLGRPGAGSTIISWRRRWRRCPSTWCLGRRSEGSYTLPLSDGLAY
jgi:SAM-dependent methyltransferase